MYNLRRKRSRSYFRHQRLRSINKKKNIIKNKWFNVDDLLSNEVFIGKLSKGKVHCSCPMCTEKTKVWGYKKSEKAKIEQMENDIKNFKKYEINC